MQKQQVHYILSLKINGQEPMLLVLPKVCMVLKVNHSDENNNRKVQNRKVQYGLRILMESSETYTAIFDSIKNRDKFYDEIKTALCSYHNFVLTAKAGNVNIINEENEVEPSI
jgi:hypothetical protein